MINDEGFDTYVKYLALKKHFSTDAYDFVKYNGKIRASIEKFRTRNDAYFFLKLSKRDDPVNFMLANFINNPNIWIRQLLDSEAEYRYNDWRKKIESLTYTFKSDLNHLHEDWSGNFVSRDGQHPYIMTQYSQKKISLETFTILSHAANIFEYWNEKVVDKIISRDIIRLSRKYKPFLVYDEGKFKGIIRENFQL
jgi:hypothetical protein